MGNQVKMAGCFTYLGDMVSAGGVSDVIAVIARMIFGCFEKLARLYVVRVFWVEEAKVNFYSNNVIE